MYASFGTCRIYLFLDLTILNENYCDHKILLHNIQIEIKNVAKIFHILWKLIYHIIVFSSDLYLTNFFH